jgi:4-phytase/acid phosphatase
MAQVMGCGSSHDPAWCDVGRWQGSLRVSADRRHMQLTGPIAQTSGTAEAILMAYAEGRAMPEVGWGRVAPEQLQQLSQLHALLFDVYARPAYMAERVAALMRRKIVHLLEDEHAPRLSVLVGSDNNIVALASVLGMHFQMPGYAKDDPPIGGALGIELWRDRVDGQAYVRVFYQAQSLQQLRSLQAQAPFVLDLQPALCKPDEQGFCPIQTLLSRLQPLVGR